MTNYIFLDIDGVLNSEHTLDESCENMDQKMASIISDQLVKNLSYLVEKTDAKIVLSSSWRTYFGDNVNEPRNIFAIFLVHSLNKHGLKLHDMTPYPKGQFSNERGLEIKTYIGKHNIENYVVIDDEEFSDFRTHLNMSRFIQTNFGDETTTIENEGLTKELAEKAILILNKKEPLVKKMDYLIKKLESNDEEFIEKLNNDFNEFMKNKKSKGEK